MTTIKINSFAKRQTPESHYGHYEGSWETLEALVLEHLPGARQGYKPGVLLVAVPAQGFWAAIVDLTPDMPLDATFGARREGEKPYKTVTVKGKKQPATHVDIVLYSHAVLVEGNEHETDADYEIVSINPRVTAEEAPMDPETMMRNFLELPGGTKAEFTAEEFARSILYWSTRAMTSPV